ncbi:MAG TPA: hypothetical protein VE684_20625, partial [Crenalkalicoccus sp.]|nr:hypothetical protein [Crenalkalicoccus sp.]
MRPLTLIAGLLVPGLLAASVLAASLAGAAELALSANDNKMVLENGVTKTVRNPPPDTLSVIDLAAQPPALRAEIEVPASVVGPPISVAITPDQRLALV